MSRNFIITSKQDTETHLCTLPGEPWDILPRFLEAGLFIEFRRKLKRFTMIDKRHPNTRGYAPSLNRLKHEEKMHLVQFYHMIHPFSMFSFYFDMAVFVFLMVFLITAPIAFPLCNAEVVENLLILKNVVFVLIILKTFFTGYYDNSQNVVKMDKTSVAQHYLLSYFFFDVVVLVPQLLRLLNVENIVASYTYNTVDVTISVLHYVRYFWCLTVVRQIRFYYGLSTFTCKSLKLGMNILVSLGLAIALLYSLLPGVPRNNVELFLRHSEATLRMFLMVNHGRRKKPLKGIAGVVVPSVFIMLGFCFHLSILVQIMVIWFRYFSADNQQAQVYNSVNAYMRHRALPLGVRHRIYLYLEFKFQGHFYKETVIRKATSFNLRQEILLANSKKHIQNVGLFSQLPPLLLKMLQTCLTSEIYLPADLIIRTGSSGHSMFLLLAGTVLVKTDEHSFYLRDGSHFGEVALVFEQNRAVNVIAVTPCEVYKLDRERFINVMFKYPQELKELRNSAAEKMQYDIEQQSSGTPALSSDLNLVLKSSGRSMFAGKQIE